MPEFKPVNLGEVYATGEAIRGAQARNALTRQSTQRTNALMARETEIARQQNQDRARQQLAPMFQSIAQSPDPRMAFTRFQSRMAPLLSEAGFDPSQFRLESTDTPESFGQSAAEWAQALGGQGTMYNTSLPSNVREHLYFQSLSPDEQRAYLGMKRSGQLVTTGAGIEAYDPITQSTTGPVSPDATSAAITQAEANRAGAVQTAREDATTAAVVPRGRQERIVELTNAAPGAFAAVEYAMQQAQNIVDTAKTLKDHPGLRTATGFGGETLSGIPGTPAADAAAIANTLKAQAFAAALADMRAASPTGGAVGQVSDAEGARFENMYANLQQAQSYPQYLRQLDRLVEFMDGATQRIRRAYEREYGGIEGAPRFGQPGASAGVDLSQATRSAVNSDGVEIFEVNGAWYNADGTPFR